MAPSDRRVLAALLLAVVALLGDRQWAGRTCCGLTLASAQADIDASPFSVRDIDVEKLEKEWAADEEEDEGWHEDTMEWKQRMRQRVPFNPNKMSMDEIIRAASGPAELGFITLKDGYTKIEAAAIAKKYRKILKTNRVVTKIDAVHPKTLVVTDEEGNMFEIQNFVLQQPEVFKFRWKDMDKYPEGITPTPKPTPKNKKPPPKKKSKKGKKKKKKSQAAEVGVAAHGGEL